MEEEREEKIKVSSYTSKNRGISNKNFSNAAEDTSRDDGRSHDRKAEYSGSSTCYMLRYVITKLIIKVHYWYLFINSNEISVGGTSKESFTIV